MAAFYAPAAAAAPHATPTPLTSSRKQHITMCHAPKLGGGNQRSRLASSSSPPLRALSPATEAEAAAAGPAPVNVEYLAAEFAGHGVSFEPVGGSCAVKMALANGSVAHVLLPTGLVTSYKPAMWHGTVTEVLHTNVGEGPGGRAVIRGGASVDLRLAGGPGGGWSPSGAWSLRDVRGNPTTSIQAVVFPYRRNYPCLLQLTRSKQIGESHAPLVRSPCIAFGATSSTALSSCAAVAVALAPPSLRSCAASPSSFRAGVMSHARGWSSPSMAGSSATSYHSRRDMPLLDCPDCHIPVIKLRSKKPWSKNQVFYKCPNNVEIELAASAPGNAFEARCVVTLHPEALATEISATNGAASPSAVALSCGVSNHLRVSTPDATYALGLQGSDYRSVEPALSEFSIVPPDYRAARQSAAAGKAPRHRWANRGFDMVLSGDPSGRGAAGEPDGEEDDDYKHMTEEMCRIYSQAPREFTILDRGRRNSICLHRRGFEELYVFSPGSQYEWYGKYAFVVAEPAMLKPVMLRPGDTWRGVQYLRNPNP